MQETHSVFSDAMFANSMGRNPVSVLRSKALIQLINAHKSWITQV